MNLNDKQRIEAVEKRARYVIENDGWSKQQEVLIDSQIENTRNFRLTKEQAKYIKENPK